MEQYMYSNEPDYELWPGRSEFGYERESHDYPRDDGHWRRGRGIRSRRPHGVLPSRGRGSFEYRPKPNSYRGDQQSCMIRPLMSLPLRGRGFVHHEPIPSSFRGNIQRGVTRPPFCPSRGRGTVERPYMPSHSKTTSFRGDKQRGMKRPHGSLPSSSCRSNESKPLSRNNQSVTNQHLKQPAIDGSSELTHDAVKIDFPTDTNETFAAVENDKVKQKEELSDPPQTKMSTISELPISHKIMSEDMELTQSTVRSENIELPQSIVASVNTGLAQSHTVSSTNTELHATCENDTVTSGNSEFAQTQSDIVTSVNTELSPGHAVTSANMELAQSTVTSTNTEIPQSDTMTSENTSCHTVTSVNIELSQNEVTSANTPTDGHSSTEKAKTGDLDLDSDSEQFKDHKNGVMHTEKMKILQEVQSQSKLIELEKNNEKESNVEECVQKKQDTNFDTQQKENGVVSSGLQGKNVEEYLSKFGITREVYLSASLQKASASERDLRPEDCGKAIFQKEYCQLCDVKCIGIYGYQNHLQGNKHKTNLEAVAKGMIPINKRKSLDTRVPIEELKKTRHSHVELIFRPVTHTPIIGLNYITEFQRRNKSATVLCVCNLCEAKCDKKIVKFHVTGYKHRSKYLNLVHQDLVPQMRSISGNNKNERNELIEKIAWDMEKADGRGEVRLEILEDEDPIPLSEIDVEALLQKYHSQGTMESQNLFLDYEYMNTSQKSTAGRHFDRHEWNMPFGQQRRDDRPPMNYPLLNTTGPPHPHPHFEGPNQNLPFRVSRAGKHVMHRRGRNPLFGGPGYRGAHNQFHRFNENLEFSRHNRDHHLSMHDPQFDSRDEISRFNHHSNHGKPDYDWDPYKEKSNIDPLDEDRSFNHWNSERMRPDPYFHKKQLEETCLDNWTPEARLKKLEQTLEQQKRQTSNQNFDIPNPNSDELKHDSNSPETNEEAQSERLDRLTQQVKQFESQPLLNHRDARRLAMTKWELTKAQKYKQKPERLQLKQQRLAVLNNFNERLSLFQKQMGLDTEKKLDKVSDVEQKPLPELPVPETSSSTSVTEKLKTAELRTTSATEELKTTSATEELKTTSATEELRSDDEQDQSGFDLDNLDEELWEDHLLREKLKIPFEYRPELDMLYHENSPAEYPNPEFTKNLPEMPKFFENAAEKHGCLNIASAEPGYPQTEIMVPGYPDNVPNAGYLPNTPPNLTNQQNTFANPQCVPNRPENEQNALPNQGYLSNTPPNLINQQNIFSNPQCVPNTQENKQNAFTNPGYSHTPPGNPDYQQNSPSNTGYHKLTTNWPANPDHQQNNMSNEECQQKQSDERVSLQTSESSSDIGQTESEKCLEHGNIGELLNKLSSSLITNEEEAAMAFQVSKTLTQALLSFRIKSLPGEADAATTAIAQIEKTQKIIVEKQRQLLEAKSNKYALKRRPSSETPTEAPTAKKPAQSEDKTQKQTHLQDMISQLRDVRYQDSGMIPQSQGMISHSQGMIPHLQGMIPHLQTMIPHSQGMISYSQGMIPPVPGMNSQNIGMFPQTSTNGTSGMMLPVVQSNQKLNLLQNFSYNNLAHFSHPSFMANQFQQYQQPPPPPLPFCEPPPKPPPPPGPPPGV